MWCRLYTCLFISMPKPCLVIFQTFPVWPGRTCSASLVHGRGWLGPSPARAVAHAGFGCQSRAVHRAQRRCAGVWACGARVDGAIAYRTGPRIDHASTNPRTERKIKILTDWEGKNRTSLEGCAAGRGSNTRFWITGDHA
jgi:hypothetical protein